MRHQSSARRMLGAVGVLMLAVSPLRASHEEDHGIVLNGSFQGSHNVVGTVNRFDPVIGYQFNRFFAADLGVPVYFVKPSAATAEYTGPNSMTGLGNIYANLKLTVDSPAIRFSSILTGTAPTGDEINGLSTGRGSVNWTNTLSRDLIWLMPYVTAGLANTVSDTSFFVRPYTSIGFVAQAEAGSTFLLNRFSYVGISGYKVLPSGQQTIVSRLIPREVQVAVASSTPTVPNAPGSNTPGRGVGRAVGRNRNNTTSGGTTGSGTGSQDTTTVTVFEQVNETIVEADLAKDHGLSTWLNIDPKPYLSFYVGYSRSFPFDLNSVFFGTSVDFGWLIRSSREH